MPIIYAFIAFSTCLFQPIYKHRLCRAIINESTNQRINNSFIQSVSPSINQSIM